MELLTGLVCVSILCLLLMPCVPSALANAYPRAMRRLTTGLAGLELLLALALGLSHVAGGGPPLVMRLAALLPHSEANVGIYYDGTAGLMLLLVAFIGFVVSRFSIRYLDGEATQGRYFRWLSFTVGAVSLMVIAGNLLLFFVAWVMTSLGLHHLLLHYHHRAAAHRAAWTKFSISRLGDAFLISALVLTYQAFGTLDLAALFAEAKLLGSTSSPTAIHMAIGWLLMLGAVTKSAQFPFHTWLPDTMETPTPVSALMHAGIVNAGGYLIIRMSPLVAFAPTALLTLAVIGAFTACFAGVVMMTQTSVKRALAYSTIAQMGFMMLQCGLGVFSAAMLHILAHSLYKAHAFLSSGSIVSQSLATAGAKSPAPSPRMNLISLLAAAMAVVLAYFLSSTAFGVSGSAKPGGLVLAFILCLALTTWSWRLFTLGERKTVLVAMAAVLGLCLAYVGSYFAVQHVVGPTVPVLAVSPLAQYAFIGIALSFCLLFALHAIVMGRRRPAWLEAIRIHAANGFYIDAVYHRLFASLANS